MNTNKSKYYGYLIATAITTQITSYQTQVDHVTQRNNTFIPDNMLELYKPSGILPEHQQWSLYSMLFNYADNCWDCMASELDQWRVRSIYGEK
jgi:hypothetical protein